MEIKEAILRIAKLKKTFRTADVVEELKGRVTRAWVSAAISELVRKGILVKFRKAAEKYENKPAS